MDSKSNETISHISSVVKNLTLKIEKDVNLGNGLITYIYGDSSYEQESMGDIDGTPAFIFHAPQELKNDISSHEIRYNGSFENFNVCLIHHQ